MRRAPLLAAGIAGLLTLPACGASGGSTSSGKLRVVTSVAPITSIVAAVGGDRIEIEGLVPEGVNSHTFEPPPSAAKVMASCDVVFVNGLKLEESTAELAEANKPKGCELVRLGDRVLPESQYIYDFSFPKQDGKPNPHLWTDPLLAARYAEIVRDVLSARAPADKAHFAANYTAFTQTVDALDRAVRADGATVPEARRALLTYHDGYAYFARDYGWRIIGAIQPSNFEDPTPREVTELIRQVRTLQVPAIFGSEVFPSTVLETIGKETGARYVDTLRDDDLPGEPGDAEHTWAGLMRYDFVTMIEALGGKATRLKALELPPYNDVAKYPQ